MFSKPKIYKCVKCGVHDHFDDDRDAKIAHWEMSSLGPKWYCPMCERKAPQNRGIDKPKCPGMKSYHCSYGEIHKIEKLEAQLADMKKQRDEVQKEHGSMYIRWRPVEQSEAEVSRLRVQVRGLGATADRLSTEKAELKETIEKMNRDYKYLMGIEAKKCLKISDLKREVNQLKGDRVCQDATVKDNYDCVSRLKKERDDAEQECRNLNHEVDTLGMLNDNQKSSIRTMREDNIATAKECKEWEDTVNLITREFNKAEQDNAELEKELSGCKAENRGLRETLEIYNVKPGTNGSVEQVTESFKSWRYHNTPAGSINRLVCSDQEFTSTQEFKDYEFAMGLLRRCNSVEVID